MSQIEVTQENQTTARTNQGMEPATGGARAARRQQVRGLDYEAGQKALSPEGGGAPKPARELGGALVLTRDPAMSKESFLSWFADQIAAKAAAWGLSFDRKSVRLASDAGGATVIALDWPPSLGEAPVTRDISDLRLAPVDARFAVKAVQDLKGFAQMSVPDQQKLTAILQGETNALSAATRDFLRPKYLDLKSRSEQEQKTTLAGAIGNKDAAPAVVSEPVGSAPVSVALTGPQVVPQYEFRGSKQDAHVFTATFGDGTSLKVVAPKAPDPNYHQNTAQEAADAARYLPKNLRELLKEIRLNPVENPDDAYWAGQYNMPDFHSYMTAGQDGVVTIYPTAVAKGKQPDAGYMKGTMIHESGHTWSYRTWGTDKTKGKWVDWKNAMDSDRVSVSQYAKADIAEDVAETVQVYGSTKGTPKFLEYERMIPARFEILKKELG